MKTMGSKALNLKTRTSVIRDLFFISLLTYSWATPARAELANYRILKSEAPSLRKSDSIGEVVSPELLSQYLEKSHRMSPISLQQAHFLMASLVAHPRARMLQASGACAARAEYIFDELRTQEGIQTGLLSIVCPYRDGKLTVRDRSSGEILEYTNYHYANLLLTSDGREGEEIQVLDPQFQDHLISVSEYLQELSKFQLIRPYFLRSPQEPGTCYWRIFSPKKARNLANRWTKKRVNRNWADSAHLSPSSF